MNTFDTSTVKIGDRIKFKACTRSSYKVAWRKVVSFWRGKPCVARYEGCSDFIVRWNEIQDVESV